MGRPKSVHSLLRSIAGSPSSSSPSPNFPNCSSPRELASVYAAYLRSHFSVSQPKVLRSRARSYLSEVRRATCPVESHSSFCFPFSLAEFLAAASNISSSTAIFQNHKSRSFRVRPGVPQRSVLGPVLFSLFINDLPASLLSSVSCSLYTDDLAIWSSSPSVPTSVEATQGDLFRLERWSECWCLPLNPSKCEASFFSVDPHQANLQSNLLLLRSRFHFNPTPTFLAATFDRTLFFLNMYLR